ncbi:TerB family tellurite resistance protein [Flavobacterium sp. Sd200]|uniref:TerB family tellurite resistance protein n=1 Tax=Flavobacterium sp. Sd200 TaxID=2692211 RepID=UPI00136EA148|nr:TerB family tellurite resistance protein [Flavobacterium sp. Sd200]MXN91737.1 TerB family tellurite resistance protein [Flavobacterium sp. Sd200]
MKKLVILLFVLLLPFSKVSAQAQELQQLALNIEKLAQFRQILKDMKKGYEILTKGYNTVKDLTQGNFSLHEAFLDALLEVSPTVSNYKRVAEIIEMQIKLIDEQGNAFGRYQGSGNFNGDELSYIGRVYDNLVEQSLRNLDELLVVITAGQARMSDNERLEAIDRIYEDMQDKLLFLRDFNNNTTVLSIQRAKERHDVQKMENLHEVNP